MKLKVLFAMLSVVAIIFVGTKSFFGKDLENFSTQALEATNGDQVSVEGHKDLKETYNWKLSLDKESMGAVKNENYVQGNKEHFGKGVSDWNKSKSFLNINLKVEDIKNEPEMVNIRGQGFLKIDQQKYPFSIEKDILYRKKIGEKVYYVGPVQSEINTSKNNNKLVLGVEFDPVTEEICISTTIGDMSSDLGLLVFGKPFISNDVANSIYNN